MPTTQISNPTVPSATPQPTTVIVQNNPPTSTPIQIASLPPTGDSFSTIAISIGSLLLILLGSALFLL